MTIYLSITGPSYCCASLINRVILERQIYKQNIVVNRMSFYSSRLAYELDLSRKVQLERELEYSRALEIQKLAEAKELEARQYMELSRRREDEEFRRYQIIKNAELQQAEDELVKERIYRTEKQKEYELLVEADRRSRLIREEEMEAQKRALEDEHRRKAEALAASRRADFDRQAKVSEEAERENAYVLEQQRTQEKLEKQLRELDLEIGGIYDARDERKKAELIQLQGLDEKIFRIRQELRGSKVRQLSLEEELLKLSKLII